MQCFPPQAILQFSVDSNLQFPVSPALSRQSFHRPRKWRAQTCEAPPPHTSVVGPDLTPVLWL